MLSCADGIVTDGTIPATGRGGIPIITMRPTKLDAAFECFRDVTLALSSWTDVSPRVASPTNRLCTFATSTGFVALQSV